MDRFLKIHYPQSAFHSASEVRILVQICVLYRVCSPQSAFYTDRLCEAALNNTGRLWYLRKQKCTAVLNEIETIAFMGANSVSKRTIIRLVAMTERTKRGTEEWYTDSITCWEASWL